MTTSAVFQLRQARANRIGSGSRRGRFHTLPSEPLPPANNHIAIGRVQLHRQAPPSHRLGRDQGRAAATERLLDQVAAFAVVDDRPAHRLDWLLGAVWRPQQPIPEGLDPVYRVVVTVRSDEDIRVNQIDGHAARGLSRSS